MATQTPTVLEEQLDRLCKLPPTEFPVLSVYVDASPNQVGRDSFEPFLRKELHGRAESFSRRSPERASLETDIDRVFAYLKDHPPSAGTVVLFACSGTSLFEAVSVEASLGQSRVVVGREPHLYPLAHLLDQYRRYAALLADTHLARVFVFGLGQELLERVIKNPKTRRSSGGGFSQMRYQRHVDHRHLKHAKEAAAALTRVVREEPIEQVILSGDEVILPLVREELPKDVTAKVVDVLSLNVRTPEKEILRATLESFRRHDLASDTEKVSRLVEEYRSGGLAVVGVEDTLAALEAGQVDELLLSGAAIGIKRTEDLDRDTAGIALSPSQLHEREHLAGDLVARARRTGAEVRFVEDTHLLWDVGGVGAFLRYRLTPKGPAVPPVDILGMDF